jgi:hypothetical protein
MNKSCLAVIQSCGLAVVCNSLKNSVLLCGKKNSLTAPLCLRVLVAKETFSLRVQKDNDSVSLLNFSNTFSFFAIFSAFASSNCFNAAWSGSGPTYLKLPGPN